MNEQSRKLLDKAGRAIHAAAVPLFVPPEHSRSLKGSLSQYIKRTVAPGEEWDRAREEAWKEAAEVKMRVREEGS